MKFKQILSVKKQVLQKAELDLKKAKIRKENVENELSIAKNELNNYSEPKTINEIRQVSELIKINIEKQRKLLEKISLCEKEIAHYSHLYKKTLIDYEKIKQLYEEEQNELKNKLKRKEALMLDEIATMRFFNEKQSF